MIQLLMLALLVLPGCGITAPQATIMTMDTTVVLSNFDDVKTGIKSLIDSGKFTEDEEWTVHSAEVVFDEIYAGLMDPTRPVTYLQLFSASEAAVSTYTAVRQVVLNHRSEFSELDWMRMEDFNVRMVRIYASLKQARDSEDAKAIYLATSQYLELLSIVVKAGIAIL